MISLVTAPVHTAVPRRPGRCALPGCLDAESAGRTAGRNWPGRFGVHRSGTAWRPGGAHPRGNAESWSATPGEIDDLAVIAVRYLPDERTGHTLPDDAFAHDGMITKQGIRAVTLAALAPRPGELLWDVGAASGSIAVEWCRSATGCRAVAFGEQCGSGVNGSAKTPGLRL